MATFDYLLPYQRAWLDDPSRRIVVLKGRQIGYSDVGIGCGSVLEALEWPHDQYLISYSLRQAKELLRDATKWCKVLNTLGVSFRYDAQATQIELENGSRILAIAATPEAVRGARGTVRWDEVAFARQAKEVWTALSPILGSSPRYKAILGSTPLAQEGLFYELTQSPKWSLHRTTLLDAVRDGLPRDPDELIAESLNPRREYFCEFDAGGKYFALGELIAQLHDEEPVAPHGAPPYRRALGVDLAKISDLTSFVECLDSPAPHVTGTWMMRSVDYRTQREALVQLVRARDIQLVVIDSTKHPAFVDEVAADLRADGVRVVGRHGTHKLKSRSWPALRKAFEQAAITCDYDHAYTWADGAWSPTKSRPLLAALLKIEQVLTPTGLVTYDSRAGADGHADAASALALVHDALRHAHDEPLAPPVAQGRAQERRPRRPEIVF